MPSRQSQPKLTPRPATGAGEKSISSGPAPPDVADQRSPVPRSKENRHGLRSPRLQISSAPARRERVVAGNRTAPTRCGRGSMRRILPSRRFVDWAFFAGSPLAPAVAGRDVQVAVGPELKLAAVVVALGGMRDREHWAPAGKRRPVAARGQLIDLQRPVAAAGVEDVKAPRSSRSRGRARPRAAPVPGPLTSTCSLR